MSCWGGDDCTQELIYSTESRETYCLGHAIAHLLNHADGLERTLARSPSWETSTDGVPDDGLGCTVAERLRRVIAALRTTASSLIARAAQEGRAS